VDIGRADIMQAGLTEKGVDEGAWVAAEGFPGLSPEALPRLLDAVPVGIALQGSDGNILWVNAALARQVGLPREEIVGYPLEALPLEPFQREGLPGTLLHVGRAAEGRAEWLQLTMETLPFNGSGSLRLAVLEDVTLAERFRRQVDRLQQALHGQVSTDEETGLLNRRGLASQLETQVSRSRRYGNVLSVMAMRLRPVGPADDQPGLPFLVSTARLLRDQTRWPDIIARWADNEFVLVLPETSEGSARLLAEKLRKRFDEAPPGGPGACECEFGIAEWQKGDSSQALLERAMQALS
jgi:diguanylate cyclase (GGDEF)-like protein